MENGYNKASKGVARKYSVLLIVSVLCLLFASMGYSQSGLIHYWKLNEAAGPTYVDSEGGLNMTAVVAPTAIAGQVGNGQDFTAANFEKIASGSNTNSYNAFTVMAWVKPKSFPIGQDFGVISKSNVFMFELESAKGFNADLTIYKQGGGLEEVEFTGAQLPSASWTHIAGTFDGTNLVVYTNGSFSNGIVITGAPVTLASNTNIYEIGYSEYGGDIRYFDGGIDEVAIFDRALTAGEILWAYNQGLNDESLPVSLSSFSAIAGNNKVTLNWKTASEVENVGFEIQRSNHSDSNYETIGFVDGQFSTNTETEYSYEDLTATNGKEYWYRLVDVDVNGNRNIHYSISAVPTGVIAKNFEILDNYPNPFNPSTTIRVLISDEINLASGISLQIYNSLGQKVRTLKHDYVTGINLVKWDGNNQEMNKVPSGVYFAVLNAGVSKKILRMNMIK